MAVGITSAILGKLGIEAVRAAPEECCGILLGESGSVVELVPAANIHPTPRTHFEIDPQALIDAHRNARSGSAQVLGYYHSHPQGEAAPSATDRENAAHDGAIWAIVGAALDVTFWRDDENGFTRLPYTVCGG